MYELYIQDKNGTYQLADFGSDSPAINLQRNDISELSNRNADYSQALKLPKTPANKRIFDFIDNFTVVSDLRHRQLPCVLYANGHILMRKGSYLRFVSITHEHYEVQLLSPEKTFYNLLGENNKTLNDLSFTEAIHRGALGVIASSGIFFQSSPVFFGIADFCDDIRGTKSFEKTGTKWYIMGQFPFVKYKAVIDRLMADNGYKLVTDIENDVEYTHACIPYQMLRPIIEQKEVVNKYIKNETNEWVLLPMRSSTLDYLEQILTLEVLPIGAGANAKAMTITTNASDMWQAVRLRLPAVLVGGWVDYHVAKITIPHDGSYNFRIKANLAYMPPPGESVYPFDARIDVYADAQDGVTQTTVFQSIPLGHGETIEAEKDYMVSVKANQTLSFALVVRINDVGEIYHSVNANQFSIELTDFVSTEDPQAPENKPMPIKSNLPDITQQEFFLAFLKTYGLTIDVDEEAKIVYAYTFNHINANKPQAKDWSRKYQRGSGVQKFALGNYARKNYLRYKPVEFDIDKENIYTEVPECIARYVHEGGIDAFFTDEEGSAKQRITAGTPFAEDKRHYFVATLNFANINYEDAGYITANGQTLKEENDMLELIYEACMYNSMLNIQNTDGNFQTYRSNYAKIPRCTWNEDEEAPFREFDFDAPVKLLLFEDVETTVFVYDDNETHIGTPKLRCVSPVSQHNGPHSIKAQALLDKYYPVLQNQILADTRIIEDAEFYLTPKDIQDYSPFTPIYIDYFGTYFYINKIKNYVNNQLTKVDLVKM